MPLWSINTIVALLSFVIAAAFGKALIPFLHKLKFGQPIKMKFGPEWHAKKQGTPTMGGILFILSTTVAVGVGYGLYRGFCTNAEVSGVEQLDLNRGVQMFSCAIFAILFGLIGFIDDFKKVVQKKNDGLSPMQKIVLQVVVAAAWLGVQYWLGDRDTRLDFSFFSFDISWFYYPLMLLVILYLTNAVNLTDGIDGLCGTVTMVNMLLAADVDFYNGTCRRLSGILGLESASGKVFHGRHWLDVFGCVCGSSWLGNTSASGFAAGCIAVHLGSPVRCDSGHLFQVYKEEIR